MTLELSGTEVVTAETLKKAFHRWHQGRALPPELLDLQLLAAFSAGSITSRSIYLYDYLFDLVVRQLCSLGAPPPLSPAGDGAGIHHSARAQIAAQIARDFAFNDGYACPERMAWSALFYRYLAPVRFSSEELAQIAGLSDRHVRRLVERGLRYLARELCRAEMAACQQ